MVDPSCPVKAVRKEMEQCEVPKAEAIDIVRPVNQASAPDHDGDQRKVDPVEPPHSSCVISPNASHLRHPLEASVFRVPRSASMHCGSYAELLRMRLIRNENLGSRAIANGRE
jgi:hypothetical protein